ILIAFGWTLLQPKVYTADANGIVTTDAGEDIGSSFTSNSLARQKLASYVQLGELRSVAEYAIEQLDIDTTPELLVRRVTVSNPNDTLFLRVVAEAGSAAEARDLAEVWVRGLEREVNALESGDPEVRGSIFLEPRDSARLPSSPSSPNVRLALMLGALV